MNTFQKNSKLRFNAYKNKYIIFQKSNWNIQDTNLFK